MVAMTLSQLSSIGSARGELTAPIGSMTTGPSLTQPVE
jgi:hypothetical protein